METQVVWSMIILGIWVGSVMIPFTFLKTQDEETLDDRDKKSLDDATTGTHFLKR